MKKSANSLHCSVRNTAESVDVTALARVRLARTHPEAALAARGLQTPVEIALKTVSEAGSFDSWIKLAPVGAEATAQRELMVDSGSPCLIHPYCEDFEALPGFTADYQILQPCVTEPWGCPARILRGPISLPLVGGGFLRIDDCTFFACTAKNADDERTANFGCGAIAPWLRFGDGIAMQSPLTYCMPPPVVEFDFVAESLHSADGSVQTDYASRMYLHADMPPGFRTFDILRGSRWMTIGVKALSIAGQTTSWPSDPAAVAMIDTGGTCVFLSDPGEFLCQGAYPDPARNPDWTSKSKCCETVACALSITLGGAASTYSYTIDPASLPESARERTLVMCRENEYMRGLPGLNTGGISLLVNRLAIDYAGMQVGWQAK